MNQAATQQKSASQPAAALASAPRGLRLLIIAASFYLVSLTLTVASGSAGIVLGTALACLWFDRQLASNSAFLSLRTLVLLTGILAFALLHLSVSSLLVKTPGFTVLADSLLLFNVAEFIRWFGIGFSVTATLRTLARRSSLGAILEILIVAAAITLTLAAHRGGMIHRPFFLGDFALIRGIDPANMLMAFGCISVIALSALLMAESNHRRLPYHFTVLAVLCFALVGFVNLFGMPTPSMTDDLGLTGQQSQGEGGQQENPFRDGENSADDKEAPVAVVVFRDDYEPASGSYYFREGAYSQFNGQMLDFSTRPDMDVDLVGGLRSGRSESQRPPPEGMDRRLVRTTIGTLVPHRSPFGLDTPIAFESAPNPNSLRFKNTFDAYSMVPEFDLNVLFGRATGHPDWSNEVRQEYLELPDDPRYGQLANQLIANLRPQYADDEFAKAWAIKSYLDENGIYSLKNEHAYAEDPAASFLFGDLTGYCMHFAFAATYMYRSIGIPARVGIGYSVPAANRAGGSSLLIQAIHGHAWPEVYFEGVGWVIIDPAPQQTLVDMTTDPQNELQQMLGDMLRDDAAFDEFLADQRDSIWTLDRLMQILGIVGSMLLATAYLIKAFRQLRPSLAGPEHRHRLAYLALLDRLSGLGLRRMPGESREAFARRLSQQSPSFITATAAHLGSSLGTDDAAAQNWEEPIRRAGREAAANVSPWRRLLALLNPCDWLLTR